MLNSSPPWTKWPPFSRRYFQLHFNEWKFCILIKISMKFVPNGPIDNNPALVQIIMWNSADPVHWRIYAALGGDELIPLSVPYCRTFAITVFYTGRVIHKQFQPVPENYSATYVSCLHPHLVQRWHLTSTRNHILEIKHDDVIKWKHFPRYWPFVWGIHRWPVNSPHKGQWRGALIFSLNSAFDKRLSKQSWGWWFETPSWPLWRHSYDIVRWPHRHSQNSCAGKVTSLY